MRIFKLTLIALAAVIAWTAAAEAIEVKKRREAPGTPAGVWKVVGDFCAIKNWHPAVAECVETTEGGDVFRMLTLKDSGKIKEKLTDKTDTSYSYEILESPLPVQNYKATLMVGEDDEPERIEIVWKSEFDAKEGTSDEDAKKIITGIFNDGVAGIKKVALKLTPAEGEDSDDDE